MMQKLHYLYDHREEIAAWFVAAATAYTVAIATPLARLIKRPPPEASWWKRGLYDLCIDTPSWLAALERSGIAGGLFNVPGAPSRQRTDNPTPSASRYMRMAKVSDKDDVARKMRIDLVLPLLLAVALAAACGAAGTKALGNCEVKAIPQALQGLLVRVAGALFMPGADWTAQLEQAGQDAAPGQLSCLVQAVTGYIEDLTTRRGQIDDRFAEAQRRGRAFLSGHPPSTGCAPLPRKLFSVAVREAAELPSGRLPSLAGAGNLWLFGGGGATGAYILGSGR
jgi:hypothetical protein